VLDLVLVSLAVVLAGDPPAVAHYPARAVILTRL